MKLSITILHYIDTTCYNKQLQRKKDSIFEIITMCHLLRIPKHLSFTTSQLNKDNSTSPLLIHIQISTLRMHIFYRKQKRGQHKNLCFLIQKFLKNIFHFAYPPLIYLPNLKLDRAIMYNIFLALLHTMRLLYYAYITEMKNVQCKKHIHTEYLNIYSLKY